MPRFNLLLAPLWIIACCLAVILACPFDNELSAQQTDQSQRTEKAQGREDLLVADFEGDDYGGWQVEGDVLGAAPARGTLVNQQEVSGFKGRGLVNTYLNGDAGQGRLVSPKVVIERRYVNFLIGGGSHPGKTGMNLLVDGRVVRSATGTASTPADDEHLSWHTWDVSELAGKQVQFEIFDRHSEGWGHINVDHVVQSDRRTAPEHAVPDIARAMSSVEGASARAEADATRPVYHFRPPALWMNDPNGPIHHGGFYHMFYQHNPYGDRWQHMHWGHARSRDLVHWEHLPIALAPRPEAGEEHCFSGCAVQNAEGQIMLLYTSIGPERRAGDSAQQFAAVATDESLIHWRPHPANPVLDESLHGDVKIYDWRDPFVFHHEGRTYMVLGGNLNRAQGGKAVVAIYQAENRELSRWRYLGILFTHPDAAVTNIECPNFFKLGDKWLLIVSPHRRVEYFFGQLRRGGLQVRARAAGLHGSGQLLCAQYAAGCCGPVDRLGLGQRF